MKSYNWNLASILLKYHIKIYAKDQIKTDIQNLCLDFLGMTNDLGKSWHALIGWKRDKNSAKNISKIYINNSYICLIWNYIYLDIYELTILQLYMLKMSFDMFRSKWTNWTSERNELKKN